MDNSFPKVVEMQTDLKYKSVLSVFKFACASWYSMNLQNDEFKTVITFARYLMPVQQSANGT